MVGPRLYISEEDWGDLGLTDEELWDSPVGVWD